MNLIIHIPDELAQRVSGVDSAPLERAALEAVLHVAEQIERSRQNAEPEVRRRAPAEAATRMRAARVNNTLPEGVTIRDLMTHGRA